MPRKKRGKEWQKLVEVVEDKDGRPKFVRRSAVPIRIYNRIKEDSELRERIEAILKERFQFSTVDEALARGFSSEVMDIYHDVVQELARKAFLDANFSDFPLFDPASSVGYRRKTRKVLKVEWGDGYALMSNAFGLPTPADADVFLAIMMIGYQRALESGSGKIERAIPFTFYEVSKILNGRNKKRIRNSLDRMVHTLYKFKETYYKDGKRITVERGGLKLFTYYLREEIDMELLERYGLPLYMKEKNFIYLDEFFYENLFKYYTKIDLDKFLKLRGGIAKRLAMLLSHRMATNEVWTINIKQLFHQIPVDTYIDSKHFTMALNMLKSAVKELREAGFILFAELSSLDDRDKASITFVRELFPDELKES